MIVHGGPKVIHHVYAAFCLWELYLEKKNGAPVGISNTLELHLIFPKGRAASRTSHKAHEIYGSHRGRQITPYL